MILLYLFKRVQGLEVTMCPFILQMQSRRCLGREVTGRFVRGRFVAMRI